MWTFGPGRGGACSKALSSLLADLIMAAPPSPGPHASREVKVLGKRRCQKSLDLLGRASSHTGSLSFSTEGWQNWRAGTCLVLGKQPDSALINRVRLPLLHRGHLGRLGSLPARPSQTPGRAPVPQTLRSPRLSTENTFCSGDHVSWHSPLDNSESRIQHMLLTEDPQMQPVQTPFGVVTFLQVRHTSDLGWSLPCGKSPGGTGRCAWGVRDFLWSSPVF